MNSTKSKRTLLSAILAIAFVLCAAMGIYFLMPKTQSASAENAHDTTHSGWSELTADTATLTGGNNYYLSSDVDLTTDLTVSGTVTLCLNGYMLTGTGSSSVITVESGATLTLCDCNGSVNTHYYTVDENTGLYEFGGVTTKTEGAKALEGGVIAGGAGTIPATTTNLTGGGIYVDGGTFNMNGGSVAGNTARVGAGLYVGANSTFNMYEGAQITGNSSTSLGGGISTIGTCNIYGGKIDNNTTNGTDYGGGAGIQMNAGTFNMHGGSISHNTAKECPDWGEAYGGGVALSGGTFTFSGGDISHNIAEGWYYSRGGGIDLLGNSSFKMIEGADGTSGTISYNEAMQGGGIYINAGSGTTVSGGVIGGKIIKNTAEENAFGGGVYAVYGQNASSGEPADPSIIELSGSPVISGNLAGGIANDLEIDRTNGNKIMITGALRNSAHVGIIDQSDSAETEFSSGYSEHNGTEDPATYFFTDDAVQSVQLSEAGEIEVVTGQYTIVYVDLNGTSSEKSFTIGDDVSLEKVAAQTGYIGGWTTYRGGTSIIYDSEQTITGGLGTRHGDIIYLYAVQERDFDTDIDQITTDLAEAVEAVNTALESGTTEDLATALANLIDAYKAADDALATDISGDMTELENTLIEADKALDIAIKGVQENLDKAVKDLEEAIAAKADSAALTQAINGLTTAYKAADELINADIDGIESDISGLESKLDETQTTLQESINTVQNNLESEIERLEELINSGGADTSGLENALAALDEAYKAADALIRTDFAAADDALAGEIAADLAGLEASLESADEAIWEAIEALQAAVDGNSSDIDGLTTALWIIGAVAVIALAGAAAGIVLALRKKNK